MVENTSASIKTIKNTDKEPSPGLMVDATRANGTKASSMVREFISKKARREMESGKWVKESSGLKMALSKHKISKKKKIDMNSKNRMNVKNLSEIYNYQ
jgi:hypothetical protein